MDFILGFNNVFFIIVAVLYAYLLVYYYVSVFAPKKELLAKYYHKYAFMIVLPKNERKLRDTVESIKNQDYPADLIDILVISPDHELNLAAAGYGCVVFECNESVTDRSSAIKSLIGSVYSQSNPEKYEGFVFVTSDDVFDENYIRNVNVLYDNGYNVVCGRENSFKYNRSIFAASFGLFGIIRAGITNRARMSLLKNSLVSDSCFMLSDISIRKTKGFRYVGDLFDREMSIRSIIENEHTGYSYDSVYYSDTPVTPSEVIHSVSDSVKNNIKLFARYFLSFWKSLFKNRNFLSYDLFAITGFPTVLNLLFVLVNVICLIIGVATQDIFIGKYLTQLLFYIVLYIVITAFYALLAELSEWDRLGTSLPYKLLSPVIFALITVFHPVFLLLALIVKKKLEKDGTEESVEDMEDDILGVTNHD